MTSMVSFPAHVGRPELVRPETTTPREFKYLSNIDDQISVRNHLPFVHFYPPNKSSPAQDPFVMIKEALAKVLVYYYPVAGMLRSSDNGKLVVDCCGEGVVFREADADISTAQLRKMDGGFKPPFPMWDRLLVDDIWGSCSITDSPLLHIQVTRLACGGFVLAYIFNHCICDGSGAYMFITALSEFCLNPDRKAPSTQPSWGREILKPRTPPIPSNPHPEYDVPNRPSKTCTSTDFKCLAQTSIFFSISNISALKNQLNGPKTSDFNAVAACLWRARTRTSMKPNSVTRFLIPVDTRLRTKPSLPKGYYGNAIVFPCVIAKAEEVVGKPLSYAASLISEAKRGVMGDEHRASVLDFIEANERRGICPDGAFAVTDMCRLRFETIDFGWGHALFGGVAKALVSLPMELVDRFHMEVRKEIHSAALLKPISAL